MNKVTSKDGTTIAYDQSGQGMPVIFVDGALCYRAFGPSGGMAAQLAPHFTVITYDRRGRGDSGDTPPFAVEREVEDIAALIEAVGGSAFVYGTSSGAALALHAAAHGLPIRKLALFEPPYNDATLQAAADYTANLKGIIAAGRRDDAVALFMTYVGTPLEAVEGMKHAPMWPLLEAVGHTLAYDNAVMGDSAVPTARAAAVSIPTLLIVGEASYGFMAASAHAIVEAMPNAQFRSLPGQSHDAAPEAVAPLLVEFFAS